VTSGLRDWDRLALIASFLTVVMAVGYVVLIEQQGNQPAPWFIGGLIMSALLSAYGGAPSAPRRTTALTASGTTLVLLGILGIASIGVPIVGAGALALLAAARSRSRIHT
jgi:hypothetical protein